MIRVRGLSDSKVRVDTLQIYVRFGGRQYIRVVECQARIRLIFGRDFHAVRTRIAFCGLHFLLVPVYTTLQRRWPQLTERWLIQLRDSLYS